jgi:preprotein translocase subunit SecB
MPSPSTSPRSAREAPKYEPEGMIGPLPSCELTLVKEIFFVEPQAPNLLRTKSKPVQMGRQQEQNNRKHRIHSVFLISSISDSHGIDYNKKLTFFTAREAEDDDNMIEARSHTLNLLYDYKRDFIL